MSYVVEPCAHGCRQDCTAPWALLVSHDPRGSPSRLTSRVRLDRWMEIGMGMHTREYVRWMIQILLLTLIIGCGPASQAQQPNVGTGVQSGSGTTSASSNMKGTPMPEPHTPVGLDAPVTGGPGQASSAAPQEGVRGRVVDAVGKPLAGVLVTAQSTDTPPRAVPEIAVMTDQNGRFQWPLPAGNYTLSFSRDGYVTTTQAVVVKETQLSSMDVALKQQ
jgi:hypothetical protein